jgi:hypothetical protein
LQVSSPFGVVVEQRVAFGVQAPVQLPDSHRTTQGVSSTHWPGGSHRCGVFSLHWRVPGEHTPPASLGGALSPSEVSGRLESLDDPPAL